MTNGDVLVLAERAAADFEKRRTGFHAMAVRLDDGSLSLTVYRSDERGDFGAPKAYFSEKIMAKYGMSRKTLRAIFDCMADWLDRSLSDTCRQPAEAGRGGER
jgi:hypothetical protein